MNLEDHLGDILRKGRLHAGVGLEPAAAAASLTVPELEALEESGGAARPCNIEALAALIGLDASKLRAIAAGWNPQPVDLGAWREIRVITTTVGMSVNAYLVWDEGTHDAALFDTGFDPAPVFALIQEHDLQMRHLFITHGHADHVAALPAIRARFPKMHLHSSSRTAPADQRNRPDECLQLGSLLITHRDTPGHAEDGVTYVIGTWPDDAPHVAIVGDALFAGSMGRATGQALLARQRIRECILTLPPATLLCPGHGPLTTVAEEKAHNPFF